MDVKEAVSDLTAAVLINAARKRLYGACTTPEKFVYALGVRSINQRLTLPDFLGIGAQKAGTTWLHENLRRHPELYLPEEKEVHYFDWNFHRTLGFYSGKFRDGAGQVKGDITPGYGIIRLRRIRFVRRIMPTVKLIFLMRNPIDRAWAQALMNIVMLPKRKFEEVDESEFYAHFLHKRSVRRGNYFAILHNWLSIFPSERLYIGFFEDVANRPKELLSEIFAHLGVSRDVDWSSFPYKERIFQSPEIPMPMKYRDFLEKMYCSDIERLYERFGAPIARWRCHTASPNNSAEG